MRSPARALGSALLLLLLAARAPAPGAAPTQDPAPAAADRTLFRVGAARVDVTPDGPIRLSGYAARSAETEQIVQPLYVRALALDDGADGPAVLLAVDNVGVPAWLTERVAARLQATAGLPRARFVVASSHTHTGPLLTGSIPNMFGADLPADQTERVARYTDWLGERMEAAARAALADLRPGSLATGRGSVGFAANRRTAGGPVDHDLPFLVARDAAGAPVAILANYACHCTTLGGHDNYVCGDWAGFAAEELERAHPSATALITIGCGADANPAAYGLENARAHGRTLAQEVARVTARGLRPLGGPLRARLDRLSLPYDALPSPAEWEARLAQGGAVAHHARKNLDRIARGEALPAALDYPVASWTFGADLALVFLAGEVVVDYALRLKREHDAERTWITAYANDVPCYVPSERILREGGYEAEGAMIYYDRPTRLARGVEQRIVDAVRAQLPDDFRRVLGVDLERTEGIAPKTPVQALTALVPAPGLRVELAVAEPLIESPVALDFGADGAWWVCEMRDYPLGLDGAGAPGGRIAVLRDRDGDGRPDARTTFLDDIPFPTGVTAWRRGALICASDAILYAEDRDGDDRADEVRRLYDGFRTDNYQARVNSLELGLDGWIHGAVGLPAGWITSWTGARLELGGRDFRIRPDDGAIEALAGATQQGRCRDDFGQAFGCDNSTLLRHSPLEARHLDRNPFAIPPPTSVLVPRAPDAHRVFPRSRILERFNDPEAAGRVTSGCGVGLYRDARLGAAFAGNSFTCEPVHNLVTRLVLTADGATFAGARAPEEEQSEFLASTDPWFRPVQARTGPDGALYVVDMARFVIEHPTWIPAERLAGLDVRAGAAFGRIWRIVPAQGALPAPAPITDDATALSAILGSNGTRRDLAFAFLLDPAREFPLTSVRAALTDGAPPAATVALLALLDLRGGLRAEDLVAAARHAHPEVRRHAARLAEPRLEAASELREVVLALTADAHAGVRAQAAAALGACSDPRVAAALIRALDGAESDPYVRAAWRSSALPHLAAVLREPGALDQTEWITLAVQTDDARALETIATAAADALAAGHTDLALRRAADLLEAFDRRGGAAALLPEFAGAARLRPLLARARGLAQNPTLEAGARARATVLMARDGEWLRADCAALADLLGSEHAPALQQAALAALARTPHALAAAALLDAWERLGPALRPAALDALLARPAGALAFLTAAAERPALRAAVDATRRAALLEHADADLRARARALFTAAAPERSAVLARYGSVRTLAADAPRGAALYRANCATCHVLDGFGQAIGPDLMGLSDRSTAALLTAILDPDRAINPEYANYTVRTRDGRQWSGLVREESAAGLRLLVPGSGEQWVMRSNLAEVRDTGASLMPRGFEEYLDPQAMADLIAYVQGAVAPPKRFAGNEPTPARVGSEATLELRAATAEIRGPSLVFEQPFQNLGFWHALEDRAEWIVISEAPCTVELELEYACDPGSAGNLLRIESELGDLTFRVTNTGSWSQYERVALGALPLPAGRSRIVARAAAPLHGALLDLRALRAPASAGAAQSAAAEPTAPSRRFRSFAPSEVWPIAIAAGRANDAAELRGMLEEALPAADAPLLEWQAVVIGGGIVNGLSQAGLGPRERLAEILAARPDLSARLARAVELAVAMAADPSFVPGTRYDALRLLGLGTWEKSAPHLLPCLTPGAHPELQMGAVSALGDLADPRAWDALRAALPDLTPDHRALAEAALDRVPTLEQCLDSGFDLWGEFALRRPDGPTYEFFAGLLPPLRYVNAEFRAHPLVIALPGSRIKPRIASDGAGLDLPARLDTWSDAGRVPARLFVQAGDAAREPFGADPARLAGPALADDGVTLEWRYASGGAQIGLRARAWPGPPEGLVHLRFTTDAPAQVFVASAAAGFGPDFARAEAPELWQAELRLDRAADLYFVSGGAAPPLGVAAAARETARAAAWAMPAAAPRLDLPEEVVMRAWRASLAGTRALIRGDEPLYSAGSIYETTFQAECGDAVRALLAWGAPEAPRLVPALLARPQQQGIGLHDVGHKAQLLAQAHAWRRDPAWTRALLRPLLTEMDAALAQLDPADGLAPPQAYCGDVQDPCRSLQTNASLWRGLRDLAVLLETVADGPDGAELRARAARYAAAAAGLRAATLSAVAASETESDGLLFLPIALFGDEQPYARLTESMRGSYWNLLAPYVQESGILAGDARRERAMLDFQLRRGGLCMGMVRFDQHSGLYANEDAVDDLYTLRLVEDLLRRGEADRALVSFYGKLAQGFTRDTFVGGEGTGLRPLDARGRALYLPPNAAGNAFFLLLLRHLLVQELDQDADGRPDALQLLRATPRTWLRDGNRIACERMPTAFGAVTVELVSELAQGRVRVRVMLPPDLTVPARLTLRLPPGWQPRSGAEEVLLPAGGGEHDLVVPVRPTPR